MLHDGPEGFLGGVLVRQLRIAGFAPDMADVPTSAEVAAASAR